MDPIRWPGLLRRVRGRKVTDLYYDPTDGAVLAVFENRTALRIEADCEGCQVNLEARRWKARLIILGA